MNIYFSDSEFEHCLDFTDGLFVLLNVLFVGRRDNLVQGGEGDAHALDHFSGCLVLMAQVSKRSGHPEQVLQVSLILDG